MYRYSLYLKNCSDLTDLALSGITPGAPSPQPLLLCGREAGVVSEPVAQSHLSRISLRGKAFPRRQVTAGARDSRRFS